MRKVLIDKCEEVINSAGWPGEQAVKPTKIFNDLKNFFEGEISMTSIPDDELSSPNHNTSFMPAISQKNMMKHRSRDAAT
jgi:hypothetical protein